MRIMLMMLGHFGKRIENIRKTQSLSFSHTYRCRTMDRMSMARFTKLERVIAEIKHTAGQREHNDQAVNCGRKSFIDN